MKSWSKEKKELDHALTLMLLDKRSEFVYLHWGTFSFTPKLRGQIFSLAIMGKKYYTTDDVSELS